MIVQKVLVVREADTTCVDTILLNYYVFSTYSSNKSQRKLLRISEYGTLATAVKEIWF